jgi:hypothetical protein
VIPAVKRRIEQLRGLSRYKKLSLSLMVLTLVFIQVIGLLSIMAFSSVENVISNIKIPDGPIYLNLNIKDPQNMEVSLPYSIQNPSIYDLGVISIKLALSVDYYDKSSDKNVSSLLFSNSGVLSGCKALSTSGGEFKGFFSHFNITAVNNFQLNFDFTKNFRFYVNIEIRTKYFFDLIKFTMVFNDISLAGS